MILTCPACGTQYVVKDGAIPPGGRKVRCASCRHSWHQDPEPAETLELPAEAAIDAGDMAHEPLADAESDAQPADEPGYATKWTEAEDRIDEQPADETVESETWDEPPTEAPFDPDTVPDLPAEPEAAPYQAPAEGVYEPAAPASAVEEDEFSPFARRDAVEEQRRSPFLRILLLLLLVAAAGAAFWFLAPPAWKARLGLAGIAETPLQLMMTHSDRQRLESGQEVLAVSGRVINPTEERQTVPPITAELRNGSGKIVHRWSIAPPARTLEPGASATFNSAEVNVPAGGEELTVSLGAPRA